MSVAILAAAQIEVSILDGRETVQFRFLVEQLIKTGSTDGRCHSCQQSTLGVMAHGAWVKTQDREKKHVNR